MVGRLKDPTSKEPLWAIDLPARRWVTPTRTPPSRARTRGCCLGSRGRTFWANLPTVVVSTSRSSVGEISSCPRRRSSWSARSASQGGTFSPVFGGTGDRPAETGKRKVCSASEPCRTPSSLPKPSTSNRCHAREQPSGVLKSRWPLASLILFAGETSTLLPPVFLGRAGVIPRRRFGSVTRSQATFRPDRPPALRSNPLSRSTASRPAMPPRAALSATVKPSRSLSSPQAGLFPCSVRPRRPR